MSSKNTAPFEGRFFWHSAPAESASAGIASTYDFENHMVQKGAVTIVYDGDGNRVAETVGGVTTKYLVDTQNPTGYAQVVDELQNGVVTKTHSYGLERISENWQPTTGNWQRAFYGYDGHGSVRFLTSSAGTITDTYDYDAFGNLTNSTGSTPNNYLFAGEAYDSTLGLYYNRARYLNTSTGRFWSMDTDEGDDQNPTSLNKYLDVGDNPVDRFDASGHDFGMDGVSETLDAIAIPNFSRLLLSVQESIGKQPLSGGAYTDWQKYQSKAEKSVFNPECVKCLALAGTTPDALAAEIAAQIAWDGTASKIKLPEAGMFPYNWSTNLARTVKALNVQSREWFEQRPKVRAYAALGDHGSHTHEVYFSHSFTQITVIHEALHWVTLLDDEDLAKALGAKNLESGYDYSEYISTKLSDSHCDKQPKGQ